ncbi:MAG: 5'-3' exonuclease H3TH domain-containing protein [Dehalococcoidia bacterium]
MFLIIDGNNVAWAGYYALERAMKPEDDERRLRVALLGLAGMALGAIARGGEPPGSKTIMKPSRVAICFDGGSAVRRREVYPDYQTGREADPKFVANEPIVTRGIEEFRAAVRMLPIEVLKGEDVEADDLIAGLVHAHPKMAKRIVSSDRDFLQLISPTTSIYSPVKKVVVDEANFDDETMPKSAAGDRTPFPRARFLDFRALCGDTSDDLPGVPGIGPLSAAKLLASGPVDVFFGDPEAVRGALGRRSEAVEASFADGSAKAIVNRNRALMDLRTLSPVWAQIDALTVRGTADLPRFEAWLDDQKIGSIDREQFAEAMLSLAPDAAPAPSLRPKLL